MKVLIS